MKLSISAAIICVMAMLFILLPGLVHATWKAEYADNAPEVQQWYRDQELTPEAQEIFHFKSCCAHADVVETQFKVNKEKANDEWWYMLDGAWTRVPDYIIHWDASTPGGKPILFAVGGRPVCFFPPGGGI